MADKLLNYLEPEQLASLIKDTEDAKDLVIIDVRNEYEFASGHINGAIHCSSDTWIEEPSTANNLLSGNMGAKKIVVHCFLSQQRGPNCARLLNKALENVEQNSSSEKPEIYVLRGGYSEWSKQYVSILGLMVRFRFQVYYFTQATRMDVQVNEGASTKFMRQLHDFVIENFLLVGFCGAVIFAFLYPAAGELFYSWKLGEYHIIELLNNCFVFFISGITLKLEDLKDVLKHKIPIFYSLLTINFVSTLLAFGIIRLPFLTKDFAIGLTIFCTVPTTLGVGVALTLLAKGDQILSLFLTVVSNLMGTLTVPFLLGIYLKNSGAIHIDSLELVKNMTIAVLIPTLAGMVTRHYIASIPAFTKQYKTELSMLSTFNLVMIVWMALSSARDALLAQRIRDILITIIVAASMHIFYLLCNSLVVSKYILNIAPRQAVSVIIMASQKSSPVALAVITSLATDSPEQKGLFALPCIIGQLSQIFIGSFVVTRLAKWVDESDSSGYIWSESGKILGGHNIASVSRVSSGLSESTTFSYQHVAGEDNHEAHKHMSDMNL